jgi:hypothetical protein
MSGYNPYVAKKLAEIKEKGVRKNTHAPVSSSNPRRAVPQNQVVAIALSEARRKGYKVPPKK